MKDLIYTLFANYKDEIIFLHVISAVIWVGGMIALRYAAHQSIQQLQSPLDKLQRTAYALKRLFIIVAPFIVINYLYMVFRRNKAQKLIDNGNLVAAKAALAPIGAYLVPINIALGIIAIYLGVVLQAG